MLLTPYCPGAVFLPSLTGYARTLTPDAAVLLATAGVCLGFVEFNRPGRVLPGAVGLLLLLFACAALAQHGVRPGAVVLLVCAVLVLLANLWRPLPVWVLIVATLGLVSGLRLLVPATEQPGGIHTLVAILCGGLVGALSGALTRIAYRARRSKALD